MPHYEYDKDYPFAAFITNLGKYNEGDLVGEWVKFPTTPEEMQKVFERIGIGRRTTSASPTRSGSSLTMTAMWTASMTSWASMRAWTSSTIWPPNWTR